MTQKTSLQSESVTTSWSISNLFEVVESRPAVTNTGGIAYIEFESLPVKSKSNAVSISDYLGQFQDDVETQELLSEGSKWVADIFYPGGKSLKAMRLSKGMSQADLAEKIGSTQNRISKIESGAEDIRRSTMKKLSEALQVSIQEIDTALDT